MKQMAKFWGSLCIVLLLSGAVNAGSEKNFQIKDDFAIEAPHLRVRLILKTISNKIVSDAGVSNTVAWFDIHSTAADKERDLNLGFYLPDPGVSMSLPALMYDAFVNEICEGG